MYFCIIWNNWHFKQYKYRTDLKKVKVGQFTVSGVGTFWTIRTFGIFRYLRDLGHFWTILGYFGLLWTILDHFGTFQTIFDHFGPFKTFLGHFWLLWTIWTTLDHFWQLWTIWNILENFGPFWTIMEPLGHLKTS